MRQNQKEGKYSSPVKATITGILDTLTGRGRSTRVEIDQNRRLDDKRVLITGASAGLGFATAKKLAALGARLALACRSGIPEKGRTIVEQTGNDQVDMFPVDLSDLQSIRALVEDIQSRFGKVDILICNAAIVPKESRKTIQGLEEMFVVNYLATYLLIRLMIDKQLFSNDNGALPKIIFISSESHRNPSHFDWDNFGRYQTYGISKTVELYGYYKLLLTTFANELARRLNPQNIIGFPVYALCPGPVNTKIAREAPKAFKPLLKLVFWLFFRSPKKAANPVIYCATSDPPRNSSIEYMHLMYPKFMDAKATDPANGAKLWELSEKLLASKGFTFE